MARRSVRQLHADREIRRVRRFESAGRDALTRANMGCEVVGKSRIDSAMASAAQLGRPRGRSDSTRVERALSHPSARTKIAKSRSPSRPCRDCSRMPRHNAARPSTATTAVSAARRGSPDHRCHPRRGSLRSHLARPCCFRHFTRRLAQQVRFADTICPSIPSDQRDLWCRRCRAGAYVYGRRRARTADPPRRRETI